MTNVPVKPISEIEVKSEVSVNDKILILDSVSEEARLAPKSELKGDKGDPGDPGTPGKDGKDGTDGTAATVTVGTTSTGAAGTSASVTNSGTSSAAVLNFTIPKGDKGDPGDPGKDGADGNGIASITSTKSGKITTVTITETNGDSDSFEISDGADGQGSGDVIGPNSSTDGHLALFDGATGKLIKDGGAVPTGVPSGGNEGDVLTNVSGTPTWQAPSGGAGDVVVSTDTGNELSTGAGLWLGTETDFSSISTPDSNTLYIQYKSEGGGWQPGVNTVAYWKLDGNTTDSGPNHITLTGTPSFATSGSLTYGVFSDDIVYGTLSTSTPITISSWLNLTNYDNSYMWYFAIGDTSYNRAYLGLNNQRKIMLLQNEANKISSTSCPENQWFNLVFTTDGTTTYAYLNGTLIYTVAAGHSISGTQVYVGCRQEPSTFQAEGWKGYMSNLIIESKVWTSQEVSDYFDLTKGDYGIS